MVEIKADMQKLHPFLRKAGVNIALCPIGNGCWEARFDPNVREMNRWGLDAHKQRVVKDRPIRSETCSDIEAAIMDLIDKLRGREIHIKGDDSFVVGQDLSVWLYADPPQCQCAKQPPETGE